MFSSFEKTFNQLISCITNAGEPLVVKEKPESLNKTTMKGIL